MKESCEVRPSQSPWPRVMRCIGQLVHRSVHRGTTELCIELRKHPFAVAVLVLTWGRQRKDPLGPHASRKRRRRSDKGFLVMAEAEYL